MSLDADRLPALVAALAGRRVAVLGDVILDEYLVGRPTRLSREAPVPVLEFSHRFCRPEKGGQEQQQRTRADDLDGEVR